MENPTIHTIDLKFSGRNGTIGAYLIPHSNGVILIETGPGSTIPTLIDGIQQHGYQLENITDVFLTHIHLDHAGAAGWLSQHGCRIHVHENGASHLINPEKLLASAGRLYGDKMDTLWGKFLPVKEEKLIIMNDDEVVDVGGLSIHALNVPGHANHHLAYLIGNACFTGDIGGIRLSPQKYLRLPMPPPDLHLEKWRESIKSIQKYTPIRIVPTHFGVLADGSWHLQAVLDELQAVQAWIDEEMPQNLTLDELRKRFIDFEYGRAIKYNVPKDVVDAQQIANPSFMSADGILRYWNKFVLPSRQ